MVFWKGYGLLISFTCSEMMGLKRQIRKVRSKWILELFNSSNENCKQPFLFFFRLFKNYKNTVKNLVIFRLTRACQKRRKLARQIWLMPRVIIAGGVSRWGSFCDLDRSASITNFWGHSLLGSCRPYVWILNYIWTYILPNLMWLISRRLQEWFQKSLGLERRPIFEAHTLNVIFKPKFSSIFCNPKK